MFLPCGGQEIDVGEPARRWALLAGFYGDEPGGALSAAWTRGEDWLRRSLGEERPAPGGATR